MQVQVQDAEIKSVYFFCVINEKVNKTKKVTYLFAQAPAFLTFRVNIYML